MDVALIMEEGVERVGSDSHSRGIFGFAVLFFVWEEESGCGCVCAPSQARVLSPENGLSFLLSFCLSFFLACFHLGVRLKILQLSSLSHTWALAPSLALSPSQKISCSLFSF